MGLPIAGPLYDEGGAELNAKAKEFGAKGDGSTDDSAALQYLFEAGVQSGLPVRLPSGIAPYRVVTPLEVENARGLTVMGGGFGHATALKGTILRWEGISGGPVLSFDGFSQGTIKRLTIDGNGKQAGVGLHIQGNRGAGPTIASQMNLFEQFQASGCQTGVQIGGTDENQGNNDQTDWVRCWFRENDVGVLWQGEQAVHHFFRGVQCYLNSEAAFRTGSASPNGGGFSVFGGYYGSNEIDFDIGRINAAVTLQNVHSELGGMFLKHENVSGNYARLIKLDNCWQNSAKVGATKSIIFNSSNNLLMIGGKMMHPVEIDNPGAAGARVPHRIFVQTDVTITRLGPTFPYKVIEIGCVDQSALAGDITFDNVRAVAGGALQIEDSTDTVRTIATLSGQVGVHGGGLIENLANGATTVLGAASDLSGLLVVRRISTDRVGVFLVHSGNTTEISDPAGVFSTVAGTGPNSTNLYVSGGNLILENNSGSANSFKVMLLGADASV